LDANGGSASTEDLRVRGELSVEKLRVAGKDPKAFAAGWRRLEVAIERAEVPGVLKPAARPRPLRVRIARVKLDEPFARVTRAASGILLPDLGAKPAAPAAKPAPAA